ncbi:hypothetical protein DSM112329_02762 [Paraconexibacter sp. AEG42_29]|uniref:LytR/CpsA/Psr regulator C-terminal domain-containing protein n=1 Tax=Paraconexibacter sp. AEG42_29 TaxID=2997339 RepID=A0AAU7AWB1_9ACTN
MSPFVTTCRETWRALGVAQLAIDEMAAELEADLADAQADGVPARAVTGDDPVRLATDWAHARGLVPIGDDDPTARPAVPAAPSAPDGGRRRPRVATVVAVAASAVSVLALAVAYLAVDGRDDSTARTQAVVPRAVAPAARPAPIAATAPQRRAHRVSVYNGTRVSGVARRAGQQIEAAGYPLDQVGQALDSRRATSAVAYAPTGRAAALEIARLLKLSPAVVAPVTSTAPAPTSREPGAVTVTLGYDAAR